MIDCTARNNKINEISCKSKDTIQDGLVSTGDISRTRDGKGANSCPDLCQIIKYTKNSIILRDKNT